MKFLLSVLVVALLHAFLSFFISFAAGLSSPRSGWKIASGILTFPLQFVPNQTPGWMVWPLWGGLSLAWGFAICSLVRKFATP